MEIRIALAGNPNCGKTTLFNALTGSNQYVGNWPGVTVEKKEGRLKADREAVLIDLPGIYSLSPYTLEEVVARNFLVSERPDAVINILDGTNLERNLYLTTQLLELGIPVIIAVNMMDIVRRNGDRIYPEKLSEHLGCPVLEISAVKGEGISELARRAAALARDHVPVKAVHRFAPSVEEKIRIVEERLSDIPQEQKRFFAIKLLEESERGLRSTREPAVKGGQGEKNEAFLSVMEKAPDVRDVVRELEHAFDDDAESIITNERYEYISSIMGSCMRRSGKQNGLTVSDKIDKIVTNRILALPVFALVMWLVYFLAMSSVGAAATDWTNDNLFGEGFHLLGISQNYEKVSEEYARADEVITGFLIYAEEQGLDVDGIESALDGESGAFDAVSAAAALDELVSLFATREEASWLAEDQETLAAEVVSASYSELVESVAVAKAYGCRKPDPANYGIFIPGIPAAVSAGLAKINCADWLTGLIVDGIVAGVGAVLGFLPQMLVLFLLLAFLEYCGYMARIAFIMDRVFRRFGLSGKSFIPMLVGMGCGVPGIMASRTIENEKDRRMTIMTATFIPCGAKMPFVAMIAGAVFGGSPWIAAGAYFIGIFAIICSGVILKKTKMFAGDPAPFVMELPAYHWPKAGSVLRSMWERGWSFVRKAGTIILLSTIVVWFTTCFGFADGGFRMLAGEEIEYSILARLGSAVAWLFIPQGWGNWQAAVASITGLVAKENIVSTLGILYGGGEGTTYGNIAAAFTTAGGFSFLVFNLLCAPCFAAMGAIRREMNDARWFWFAIGYQCGLAWLASLAVYRIAGLFTGACGFGIWSIAAILIGAGFVWLLLRRSSR